MAMPITSRAGAIERASMPFLVRAIAGFMFLFAGADKLLGTGLGAYTGGLVQAFALPSIPPSLIYAVAGMTAVLEVGLGALLLLGLWTRPAARALGAMVVITAIGYGVSGLMHPMGPTAMDNAVVNTYILPRAALLIVILLLPAEDDVLSLRTLIGTQKQVRSDG